MQISCRAAVFRAKGGAQRLTTCFAAAVELLCPGVAHRAPALQTLRRRGALGGAAGLSGAVREQQEKGMGLAQRDGQEEP